AVSVLRQRVLSALSTPGRVPSLLRTVTLFSVPPWAATTTAWSVGTSAARSAGWIVTVASAAAWRSSSAALLAEHAVSSATRLTLMPMHRPRPHDRFATRDTSTPRPSRADLPVLLPGVISRPPPHPGKEHQKAGVPSEEGRPLFDGGLS